MDDFFIYKTKEGVRWDTIAQIYYGNASLMNTIIAANPDVPITEKLPGGIELKIPVLENVQTITDESSLPPWRRNL